MATKSTAVDPGVLEARRFSRRLDPDAPHAFQVARIAVNLFDATRPLHSLPPRSRVLLETAALLHDIGHTIASTGHHKHSRNMILELPLTNFTNIEKRTIACIARYHRKAHPHTEHRHFRELEEFDQGVTAKLASLLRIADGLDRCHDATCRRLSFTHDASNGIIHVEQRKPSPEDLWGAKRKCGLFEEIFGLRLEFRPLAGTKQRIVS